MGQRHLLIAYHKWNFKNGVCGCLNRQCTLDAANQSMHDSSLMGWFLSSSASICQSDCVTPLHNVCDCSYTISKEILWYCTTDFIALISAMKCAQLVHGCGKLLVVLEN